MYVLLLLSAFI